MAIGTRPRIDPSDARTRLASLFSRSRRSVWWRVAGLLLVGAATAVGPPTLRVWAALALVLVAGLSLLGLTRSRWIGRLEVVAVGGALGYSIAAGLGLTWLALRLPTSLYPVTFVTATVLLAVAAHRWGELRLPPMTLTRPINRPRPNLAALEWAIAAGTALVFFALLVAPEALSSDGLFGVGQVRKITDFPQITPQGTNYRDVQYEPVYFANGFDLFLALVSLLARVDPLVLPRALSPWLAVWMIASFRCLTRTLFADRRLAAAADMTFLAVYGGIEGGYVFGTSWFHMVAGNFIFLTLALHCLLQRAFTGRPGHTALSALIGLAAFTIHPFSFVLYLTALGSFWLAAMLWRRVEGIDRRAILACLGLALVLCAPYLGWKFSHYEVHERISDVFEAAAWHPISVAGLFVVENFDRFLAPHYYVKPPFEARWWFVAAYLLIPALFVIRREKRARLLLVSMMIAPLAVAYTPLYSLVAGLITQVLASRFSQLAPVPIVVGFVIGTLVLAAPVFRRRGIHRVATSLAVAGLLVLLAAGRFAGREARASGWDVLGVTLERNPYVSQFLVEPPRAAGMLHFFREDVTESSVIASDYDVALLLIGYTRHFALCMEREHISIGVTDQDEREGLLAAIYAPALASEIPNGLNRYGVRFVVFDRSRQQGLGSATNAETFLDGTPGSAVRYSDQYYLVVELPRPSS